MSHDEQRAGRGGPPRYVLLPRQAARGEGGHYPLGIFYGTMSSAGGGVHYPPSVLYFTLLLAEPHWLSFFFWLLVHVHTSVK